MKVIILGICQLVACYQYLQKIESFRSRYNDVSCYTIFTLTASEMARIIKEEVPHADLVLSQPVSAKYQNNPIFSSETLRAAIKPGALHLIVANCYFTGYDPLPFQTTDKQGSIVSYQGISYFSALSLPSLLEGNILESCRRWCDPQAFTKKQLENNLSATLQELQDRENQVFEFPFGVDIKISDFIRNNFRDTFLFHTYNHPTNVLLEEIVKRICHRLQIPIKPGELLQEKELLGDVSLPPAPAVYRQLNLTFDYPHFIAFGKSYQTKDWMAYTSSLVLNENSEIKEHWLATLAYKKQLLPK